MISVKESNKEISNIKRALLDCFKEQNFIPGKTVLIKPNLSGRAPITEGENTTVYFLDALIEVLRFLKVEKIYIGHSSLLGTQDRVYPFEMIVKDAGYDKYKKRKYICLVNFDTEDRNVIEVDGVKFNIPKLVDKVDSYINLAKLKTHMEAVITFSVKNQMGLLPESGRINMHKGDLELLIGKLAKAATPTINIVEGIVGMEGNGPHHGNDIEIGKIFVGENMVELDSVISHLISLDPSRIPQLVEAERLRVGKIPSNKELGKYDSFKFAFKHASTVEKFTPKVYAWPTTSCSRCITAINESGKIMKKTPKGLFNLILAGYFGKIKHVVIGKGGGVKAAEGDKIICIGTCALGFAKKHKVECLAKCPPSVDETYEYLMKNFK